MNRTRFRRKKSFVENEMTRYNRLNLSSTMESFLELFMTSTCVSGTRVDFEKVFKAKQKKILEIARNTDLGETPKRILNFLVMYYNKNDVIEMTLTELKEKLNISTISRTSESMTDLVDMGFVEKTLRGSSRSYRLLY